MTTITIDTILEAAAYAVQHPEEYNQRTWCGTACCVLGNARRIVGSEAINKGPEEGEIEHDGSPRSLMLISMLYWTHADTAALMPHVRDDGSILVPDGGIGALGEGAYIGQDAYIGDGAIIGEGAPKP